MAVFRFPLDKVLYYRGELEKQEKTKLLQTRLTEAAEKAELDRLAAELERTTESCSPGTLDQLSWLAREAYGQFLAKSITRQEQMVSVAAKRVESQRRRVVRANQEKQVLARFRERRREEYDYRKKRLEQVETDEAAQGVFRRKGGGGPANNLTGDA